MKLIQKILIIFIITLALTHISFPSSLESTSQIQVADKGGIFDSGGC